MPVPWCPGDDHIGVYASCLTLVPQWAHSVADVDDNALLATESQGYIGSAVVPPSGVLDLSL